MPYKDPDKQREFQRKRVANRRAAFFAGKCCVRCGATDSLELDHIDPKLKVSHSIWSWSKERQDAETAKCQVLCHECHLQKTRDDMGYSQVHGTDNSYDYYGCRCAECRAAHATKKREYRARKKIETP